MRRSVVAVKKIKHQSRSVEQHIWSRREDVWPELLNLVAELDLPARELSVEPPWRFSYECDTGDRALNFFQGTFLIRDDGDECHVAWGLVFDPEPTVAGFEEVSAACVWMSEQLAGIAARLN